MQRPFNLSLFKIILCASLVVATSPFLSSALAQESAPRALKSAQDLVELLKSRVGVDYPIPESVPYDVLACEQRDSKIVLYRAGADWNEKSAVVWEWDPKESFPEEEAKSFGHVDECKPARGTSLVLICSSGGGAAIVRFADKKVLFFARPNGNTHSIELLPDGNVVTASSTGAYVALFAAPDFETVGETAEKTPIARKYPLEGGHGVVWDAKRELLWALGSKEIVGYEYVGEKSKPELKEKYRIELKGTAVGGHDFYPAPGFDAIMTTGRGVNVFDPETRAVTSVANMNQIKSISLTPDGVLMIQRAAVEWWNESLLYGDASGAVVGTNSGARFYKARWFIPNEFREPPVKD